MTGATSTAPAVERAWRQRLAGHGPAAIAMFGALACLGWLAARTGQPWVLGSFGASSVLLFFHPASPFARTRSLLGGHLLCTLTGLAFLHLVGPGWASMAAAATVAALGMLLTDTVHPPAGSNPLIVFLAQPGWDFLLMPTLAGAVILWLFARGLALAKTRSV